MKEGAENVQTKLAKAEIVGFKTTTPEAKGECLDFSLLYFIK